MKLQNAAPARPMTHDLLNDVVGQLDAEVISIAVTEMLAMPVSASTMQ